MQILDCLSVCRVSDGDGGVDDDNNKEHSRQ